MAAGSVYFVFWPTKYSALEYEMGMRAEVSGVSGNIVQFYSGARVPTVCDVPLNSSPQMSQT